MREEARRRRRRQRTRSRRRKRRRRRQRQRRRRRRRSEEEEEGGKEEEEEEKKWKRYIWGKIVGGRAKCRGGTTGASDGGEKRRDGPFFLRAWIRAASAPCLLARSLARSKLEAGSQKLPVPVESAWSWIILPKGIFIGRECMQKRGHRHKGAAPADLALTQLREWTHGFVHAAFDPSSRSRRRVMDCPTFLHAASTPLFPSFLLSFLPSFLSSFVPCFFFSSSFLCTKPPSRKPIRVNPLY